MPTIESSNSLVLTIVHYDEGEEKKKIKLRKKATPEIASAGPL